MEASHSSAKDGQKRSDARVRLRLAVDAVLLNGHHASAVPVTAATSVFRDDKMVALLEQMVAQQSALFDVIACMNGFSSVA